MTLDVSMGEVRDQRDGQADTMEWCMTVLRTALPVMTCNSCCCMQILAVAEMFLLGHMPQWRSASCTGLFGEAVHHRMLP